METELTVLTGIMIQNLPRETAWHLRGTRRIGVSAADVETIQQCVCALVSDDVCELNCLDRIGCKLLQLALTQSTPGGRHRARSLDAMSVAAQLRCMNFRSSSFT